MLSPAGDVTTSTAGRASNVGPSMPSANVGHGEVATASAALPVQETAAVRCQQACSTSAGKWASVFGGLILIGALVALGWVGFAVINGTVSIWLVRLATLVLVEAPSGISSHAAAKFWLLAVVLGVVGVVAMLIVLSSDAAIGTITSWCFLLFAGVAARKPAVRGGRAWSGGPSCVVWHLVLLLLFVAGGYACIFEALYCPSTDSSYNPQIDPPPISWGQRMSGRTCRCAGDYTGTPGDSYRSVWDGGAESCFCSVHRVWDGSSSGEGCLRECNATSGTFPTAGLCQCTPRPNLPAAVRDGSDPRCTPPQASSGGGSSGANVCLGDTGADVIELGDARCQRTVVVGAAALLLGLLLVLLTVAEVRRVMHADIDIIVTPSSLDSSLLLPATT